MTSLAIPAAESHELPGWGWWALLGLVLVLGVSQNWIAAFAVTAFATLQRYRPLDFLVAYLIVVSRASFVNYTVGGGNLTLELAVVSAGIIFMLGCYLLAQRTKSFAIPDTPMTRGLLLWGGISLVNSLRGFLAGYSPRFIGLDILGPLGLVSSVLIANRGLSPGERKGSLLGLWLMGLGHCALGFYFFSVFHTRTGSIYFTPVPGILASFFLAFALRAPTRITTLGWLLAMCPMLLHQFLSFTRGFWLALFGVFVFSIALYGGRLGNARVRWTKGFHVLLALTGLFIAGVLLMAVFFDVGQIFEAAATRLGSVTSTKASFESSSNIARLVEYSHVLRIVATQPLFGMGLGFTYVDVEVLHGQLIQKWYTHNNYLYVWLKQGLLGLWIFLWMMFAALRTGVRGRTLADPIEAAWCAGAAGATLFIILYSNVHMPLADVNCVFVLAFLWGGAMAATRRKLWVLRLKATESVDAGGGSPVPVRAAPPAP